MNKKIEKYARIKIDGLLKLRPFPDDIEEILTWKYREHHLILHLSLIDSEIEKIKEIVEMYEVVLALVKEGWVWLNAGN